MSQDTRAIIVDDEVKAIEVLANLVEEFCPQVELVGKCSSIPDAFKQIESLEPDLVFLDIQMQEGTGFDLLEMFKEVKFHVIFTTAFDHYAIQAIKYSALDYLMKPVKIDELEMAVDKHFVKRNEEELYLQKIESLLKNVKNSTEEQTIFVPDRQGIRFVRVNEIVRLKGERNYTTLYLSNGEELLTSKSLSEYEKILDEDQFMRVHKSNIVNLSCIHKYVTKDGGYLVMSDKSTVEISRRKKSLLDMRFVR